MKVSIFTKTGYTHWCNHGHNTNRFTEENHLLAGCWTLNYLTLKMNKFQSDKEMRIKNNVGKSINEKFKIEMHRFNTFIINKKEKHEDKSKVILSVLQFF